MRDPGLGSSDVWEMEVKVEMEMEKWKKWEVVCRLCWDRAFSRQEKWPEFSKVLLR